MTSLAMRCMLATVVCAMAGGVAAQTTSYTNMLNTIQMQNQSWNTQLNAYNRQFGSAAHSAMQSGLPSSPQGGAAGARQPAALPQYPITATDFYSQPGRIMPEKLANGAPNLTPEQRQAVTAEYYEFLSDFEKNNRKNNMAAALTYAVRASLFSVYGKELTQPEINQMGWNFNSVLAMTPEFIVMPPAQKQVMYENLILTGATIVFLQNKAAEEHNVVMQGQAKQLAQSLLKQWLNI